MQFVRVQQSGRRIRIILGIYNRDHGATQQTLRSIKLLITSGVYS